MVYPAEIIKKFFLKKLPNPATSTKTYRQLKGKKTNLRKERVLEMFGFDKELDLSSEAEGRLLQIIQEMKKLTKVEAKRDLKELQKNARSLAWKRLTSSVH